GPDAFTAQPDHARPQRQGPAPAAVGRHLAARQALPLSQAPCQEPPSRTVHGIWPTTLATIKTRLGGSHIMTVSACASATTAVTEAALAGSMCRWSSSVTIMMSNRPSPPLVSGTQLALRIF